MRHHTTHSDAPGAAAPSRQSDIDSRTRETLTGNGSGGSAIDRLLIVPCGREKLDYEAPARDLYCGSHFRYVLNGVERAAGMKDHVLILSALHGLVDPDAPLEPYDVTMTDGGSVTATWLARQLTDLFAIYPATTITTFLPLDYLARLQDAVARLDRQVTLVNAYWGCRGIGEQRHVIASLTAPSSGDRSP